MCPSTYSVLLYRVLRIMLCLIILQNTDISLADGSTVPNLLIIDKVRHYDNNNIQIHCTILMCV